MANNWYFIRKGSTHLPPHLAYLRFAWTFFHIGREQLQLDLEKGIHNSLALEASFSRLNIF